MAKQSKPLPLNTTMAGELSASLESRTLFDKYIKEDVR